MVVRSETTWVLLRGLVRESRHWEAFPERLSAALEAPVLALDLPGNGELWRTPSPSRVSGMVAALRRRLEERGVTGPYRVLALSLGGMMALQWACDHPREVERLVLINSSMGGLNPFYRRLRPRQYPRLLYGLCCWPLSLERRERLILRMTTRQTPDLEALARRYARWQAEAPVSGANTLRQLWAAIRYRAPGRPPGCPALLLASRQDRMVSWRCSRTLAQRWAWPLRLHPEAGHDLPLDDPEWVVERISRWLEDDRSSSCTDGHF